MDKEYLPSKIFMIRVAFIFIIIATIFGVTKLYKYFKNRQGGGEPVKVLFKDAIKQKDTNNNGIADWEEYLWGLDPAKNGPENKEFILAKKKTLENNSGDYLNMDGEKTTQNDQLSQEFFSIIMSLQEAGSLSQESIDLVSESIGQKIDATPIPDIYTQNMLIIKDDSLASLTNYHNLFKNLTTKYSDRNIGDELVFISEGLNKNDPTAMRATMSVAEAYQEFGKELLAIPIPKSLATVHLSLANNYEKTGQSVAGLTQILTDSMTGMKAIINYKKYSDALVADIEFLTDNL